MQWLTDLYRKYDGLGKTNPNTRFLIFVGMMLFILAVPMVFFQPQIAQFISILIMVVVGFSRILYLHKH